MGVAGWAAPGSGAVATELCCTLACWRALRRASRRALRFCQAVYSKLMAMANIIASRPLTKVSFSASVEPPAAVAGAAAPALPPPGGSIGQLPIGSPSGSGGQKPLRPLMQPSGMTSRVSRVDTVPPNISEMAMPWKIGSNRITLEPSSRAKAVMRIGRVRALQARMTASRTGAPACTSCLAKSTSRMELRTMIPARAMKPIIEVAVNSALSSMCPGMMPISVSGIGAMTMAGRVKLPNSQTTSM